MAETCWVIDTETTGLNEPQVIEFAYADITAAPGRVFEMGETTVKRFKPSKPIDVGAMATHHIIPDDLADCDPAPDKFDLPRYVIGHAVDYDWAALGSPADVKRIDTLALAREAWPSLDSYKLGAVTYHLFQPSAASMLKDAHSAETDILLCFKVFTAAVATLSLPITSWGDVWRASEAARVPKVMGFGKHQGKSIAEVPRDYVDWYRRQSETDPYLIKAFQAAGLCR